MFGHRFGILSSTSLCATGRGWTTIEVIHSASAVVSFSSTVIIFRRDIYDSLNSLGPLGESPLRTAGFRGKHTLIYIYFCGFSYFSLGAVETQFILIARTSLPSFDSKAKLYAGDYPI